METQESYSGEKLRLLATQPSKDYELLDSGEGEKLERFGAAVLRRPDPQALWKKQLSAETWEAATAQFVPAGRSGNWKSSADNAAEVLTSAWTILLVDLTFNISLKAFKHTGLFPEQSENWKWISETITAVKEKRAASGAGAAGEAKPITVLNLFGYTGGATLAAAKAGAQVTHVDASKVSVKAASENAKLSGLESAPIRWIIDDAMEFVKREARRGNTYDAIIMDPPSYGHGPNKELWKIEEDLPKLIAECQKILSANPVFILINGYASGYSAVAYKNNLTDLLGSVKSKDTAAEIEYGELTLQTKAGHNLPAGIFARARFGV